MRTHRATVRYWAISSDFLDDALDPVASEYKNLGALAHHLWVRDAVLHALWDFDERSARIGAVGRIDAVDPAEGSARIEWRVTDFPVTPGPNGRRHWATKPYFILDAKRARDYGLPEQFATAFEDDAWRGHRITDDYMTRNVTGERLPSLEKREGFVYLMESEAEYKIGKAVDIERRRKRLILDLGCEIGVLHAIASDDYSQAEWDLHQRFADKRIHGEWFALEPADIKWICAQERL
jgi:hypothetical protein|tara:strand:- start:128 stop:838 length:711 start_codon:yes stop_codon:yes gene_type:complete